jgi:hypothetical protein
MAIVDTPPAERMHVFWTELGVPTLVWCKVTMNIFLPQTEHSISTYHCHKWTDCDRLGAAPVLHVPASIE